METVKESKRQKHDQRAVNNSMPLWVFNAAIRTFKINVF